MGGPIGSIRRYLHAGRSGAARHSHAGCGPGSTHAALHRASTQLSWRELITMSIAVTQSTVSRIAEPQARIETFQYDNAIVRNFAIATAGWALVAFLVGLIVALKLVFPAFLSGIPFLSYGRLRPLHTNAAIFAFAGNAIFVGVYYSLQRLCKARMFSDRLSTIHFLGWQTIIVLAALTLPLGFTTSKEYAELEWPIDIAITVVWVVFGINMLGTVFTRRERHMYVAIWFYLATFITVALLHVVNSLELPVSFLKSYSMYAGVQDA